MSIPTNYKKLTDIANPCKKSVSDWVNKVPGLKAIARFKESHPDVENPIITKRGKGGGTYAHPELAAVFAAWCDPQFPGFVVRQNAELKTENRQLRKIVLEGIPYNELPRQILPAHEVERQLNTEYENRIIGMRANTDNAHVMSWLKRFEDDPLAHDLVERMFLSDASVNPGYLYDKKRWGTKARFDRACERWEKFDRIIEMMRGNKATLRDRGLTDLTPIDLDRLIREFE